jgi:hypothetical protein
MNYDELMDTFYFVESKEEVMKPFILEYPMLFSEEKITPLNFQMRMSDMANKSRNSQRNSDNRIRLST